MSDGPLEIAINGDAGDVFRRHFGIDSLAQANKAVANADALFAAGGHPWAEGDSRDIFDWAAKAVQRRFEQGIYKEGQLNKARIQPNGYPRPGPIGNTEGVILPATDVAPPGGNTNPPVKLETEAEKGWWSKASGWVHGGLDVLGLVPALGTVTSLIDAGIYAAEGDMVSAGISAAMAVPIAGNIGRAGKLAVKGGKAIAEQVGKNTAQEVAERAAKTTAKQGAKQAEKEAAEKAAQKVKGKDGGHVKRKLPEGMKGTDNKSIREWYNETTSEKRLKELNEKWQKEGASLEECAERSFNVRHDARKTAREFMENPAEVASLKARDMEKYGNPNGPTFAQEIAKYKNQGMKTNQAYQAIIKGASRTSPEYNMKFGIKK